MKAFTTKYQVNEKNIMCGLTGFLSLANDQTSAVSTLQDMASSIAHRGPDDSGTWHDSATGIGLAHRRLAIVDLSAAGHQPMHALSGRYVLVFNGEIYNHLALRQALGDRTWHGHSDTETLLAGFDVWGIEATLKRSIGMFAIAAWDKQTRTLSLARDRIGEKPLYYGWQGDTFLFGSELKSLKKHPAFRAEIDRNALCLYMRHSYIPTPHSIYQNIGKLTPGCILTVSLAQPQLQIRPYWSALEVAHRSTISPFTGTPTAAVTELEILLSDAVQQQMMADVPLGAFLSGGIDSSTIVALLQAQSACPIKTFSIGYHEDLYNEAQYAKAVALHLGTEHTEFYVTSAECMAVIPLLSSLYDEPFADSSQIPTFLVSQLAKQHVTVSLSGDAGDELFAGYNRYQLTDKAWSKLSHIPHPLRAMAARVITQISPNTWNSLANNLSGIFHPLKHFANIGEKLHKGAGVLASDSTSSLYHGMTSQWFDPASLVLGGSEPITPITDPNSNANGLDTIQRMMALDLVTYLPDDILCKVDRAAMGVSLETRVPFLDHRVVEFAWSLPMKYKLREGQTKWVLRQVLYNHVPKEMIERPKMGFGVPIDSWLRGSLREWAEDLLDESRLRQDGYFNPAPIRQKWKEHLSGQRNWQHHLWTVLMFNQWLDEQ